MSKFNIVGDIRIPRELIRGIKFSEMQDLYEQIKHRDPIIFIGVKGDNVTAQNFMVTSNKDWLYEKIVFDIGSEGPGLTFMGAKKSVDFLRGIENAVLHVRVKSRVYKVKRLVDRGNVICMEY